MKWICGYKKELYGMYEIYFMWIYVLYVLFVELFCRNIFIKQINIYMRKWILLLLITLPGLNLFIFTYISSNVKKIYIYTILNNIVYIYFFWIFIDWIFIDHSKRNILLFYETIQIHIKIVYWKIQIWKETVFGRYSEGK